MQKLRHRLIQGLAFIGICALLYAGWLLYQRQTAEDQRRAFFGAPASTPSGAPNAFRSAPPPPQP
jgi:hypothetical protein